MRELMARRKIEFSDTDMGGVVHFSRFFVFMETAEDQFLRALGSAFSFQHEGSPGGWPKAAASCEYLAPLRYGDEVEVHLMVTKVTRSTITYEFAFIRGETRVARGRTTSVCCAIRDGGKLQPVPIPAALAKRIQESLPAGD